MKQAAAVLLVTGMNALSRLTSFETPEIRVAIIMQPAFTLLALSGFVDVLRHAADEADGSRQLLCRWHTAGFPTRPIKASCGFNLYPDTPYDEVKLDSLDYLVLVGGLVSESSQIDHEAIDLVHSARSAGVGLIALCTGYFHLAKAGLLSGKKCCVHWGQQQHMKRQYPDVHTVSDIAFVEDDNIITSLGGLASVELALHLVERHCGRRRSKKCADRLCVEMTFASRLAVIETDKKFDVTGDRFLERAVEIMRSNIEGSGNIPKLARDVGISDRRLREIFKTHIGISPGKFWRSIRLHEAKWRLANKTQNITQIAFATGFSDSSHFCRAFKKEFSLLPSAFREMRQRVDQT